ncbi:MAG: hypothetical protein H6718_18190 [Polyangiaceae bacterium]|nr:hypothetical protein [Polyangiaceae bacterium]
MKLQSTLRPGFVSVLAFALLSACAASQKSAWAGDNYYQRGDYASAVVAYQVQLSEPIEREDRSGALLRLGLSYLTLATAEADARAEYVFRQLIAAFPDSANAQSARIALTRLKRARQSEATRASDEVRIARLQLVLGAYKRQLTRTRERLAAYREANSEASSERTALVKEIEGLKLKVKAQEERIEGLSKQLDAIKRIDLDRQPD